MSVQNSLLTVWKPNYLGQNHGGDLLRREDLVLTKVLDLNHRAAFLVNDLEWPRLDILLDCGVIESSSDQPPGTCS